MLRGGSGRGGVSQLKPALCAIGRYRGVSQLYCRKSVGWPTKTETIANEEESGDLFFLTFA